MIIYGLMKFIEQIPERYDRMIGFLTLGGHRTARRRILARTGPATRILDIGCGTGTLLIRAAERGAVCTGVDAALPMLAVFRRKLEGHPEIAGRITLLNQSATLIGRTLQDRRFDLITASLVLGEMPEVVLESVLAQLPGLLAEGGRVMICDELWPDGKWRSLLYSAILAMTFVPNFILTRTMIRPVKGLEKRLEKAGLRVVRRTDFALGVVSLIEAERRP